MIDSCNIHLCSAMCATAGLRYDFLNSNAGVFQGGCLLKLSTVGWSQPKPISTTSDPTMFFSTRDILKQFYINEVVCIKGQVYFKIDCQNNQYLHCCPAFVILLTLLKAPRRKENFCKILLFRGTEKCEKDWNLILGIEIKESTSYVILSCVVPGKNRDVMRSRYGRAKLISRICLCSVAFSQI